MKYFSLAAGVIITATLVLLLSNKAMGLVSDPDIFYHLKLAQILAHGTILREFPWNHYTIFTTNYMDHHFIFHLLLVPFVAVNAFKGLQLYLIVQAAAVVMMFWWVCHSNRVRTGVILASFLALGSSQFLYELNIGRAFIISIIFLLAGWWLIKRRKVFLLFLLSSLYVLAYNAFFMLLILALSYCIANYVLKKKFYFVLPLSIITGTIVGMLLHPNFPNNLFFYWIHIVRIALCPPPIPLGMGWNHYDLVGFLKDNTLIAIAFLSASIILIKNWKKYISPEILALLIFSVLLLIATFKSLLFVVYWVPFALLFSAYVLDSYFYTMTLDKLKNSLKQFWQFRLTALIIFAVIIGCSYYSISTALAYLRDATPANAFKGATVWLIANSQKGDIVFNTDWDQFPQLFYWNDKNYYIVGLDPTFMYEYDQNLYWKWRQVADDNPEAWASAGAVHNIIKNDFRSSYVFLENKRNPELKKFLETSPQEFQSVYSDSVTSVYKVN